MIVWVKIEPRFDPQPIDYEEFVGSKKNRSMSPMFKLIEWPKPICLCRLIPSHKGRRHPNPV